MSVLISCEVGGQRVPAWLVGTTGRHANDADPRFNRDAPNRDASNYGAPNRDDPSRDDRQSFRTDQDSVDPDKADPHNVSSPPREHAAATTRTPKQSDGPRRTSTSRVSTSAKKSSKRLSHGNLPMRLPSDTAASEIAADLAKRLRAPLVENPYSHQLIDTTRSQKHRLLFPVGTRGWPDDLKQRLIDEVHQPYRKSLRETIQNMLRTHPYVVHFSIRTFEWIRNGKPRRADVGLLYDPGSNNEVDFCLDWIDEMYESAPMLKVRRNYPRRGSTESVTKSMRAEFAGQNYLGIEVLLNRAWAGRQLRIRDEAIKGMCDSLASLIRPGQTDAA
tara:strand:- start:116201 stop:117196 length:996 start_codon:yes stop_codon:yes gene_type:complete